MEKRIIGVTGGVGAGKSRVLKILAGDFGAHVIQADEVAKSLMEPGKECYRRVVEYLGDSILAGDGTIDRQAMVDHVLNGHGTIAYSVCDKMPWYSKDSEAAFDPQEAERLLDEAGWKTGADGIREKDGKKAGFTMLYSAGDSVRQALSEDTANQLAAFGIHVTVEGVGWDTAYDRAQSEPLMWGWGAHTPMELYNIYHTRPGGKYAQYSPYSNGAVDAYMDEALACTDLEASYELWKKAQWDGGTGITQEGDLPWIWLVNIDHLYWVKDGLQVAEQKLHPHGHGWSIINNVDQWTWE